MVGHPGNEIHQIIDVLLPQSRCFHRNQISERKDMQLQMVKTRQLQQDQPRPISRLQQR